MADKFTSVRTASRHGLAVRGHVGRAEAIARTVAHYERQLREATEALADIRAGFVDVYHQTGLYRVHDKREVTDDS